MKNHLTLYPNLVAVRKAKCTQKELADYLGISQQEISRYERGEIKASINYLCDVADFCGVSVDYILGREARDRVLLRPDETHLLEIYGSLTEENRLRLTERAETLSELQNH
jgi:transcriptional regulator with XRE-family HTH domain